MTPEQCAVEYCDVLTGKASPKFTPALVCYPGQLAFVNSQAKRKVLRKTRRAGGTVALATWYLEGALSPPYANQLYVTSTLKNAKRLVWPTLKKLNAFYNLGGVPNDSEGFMRFPRLPNEPVIYLGGAKDSEEIEKIRGYEGGLKRAAIDEAQAIRPSIMSTLVDDIIEPSLLDYDGELCMVGTPGPVLAGYFYDADKGALARGWEHFFLDLADNPYLAKKSGKTSSQLLAEIRERKNWAEDNPTFLREYRGEWVTDTDALALHYNRDRNGCEWQTAPQPGWRYIQVFDIGFDDADAMGILGHAPNERRLRLVRERVKRKQGITELGNMLREDFDVFRPERLIGDLGALGKKIGAELTSRWNLPVEAADKTRKAEHIGLLDDALRTATFLAPADSQFAEDCNLVTWDPDARARGRLEFDPSYHSDAIDMVLYGYRLGLHWLEPPADKRTQLEKLLAEENDAWMATFTKPQAGMESWQSQDDQGDAVGYGGPADG